MSHLSCPVRGQSLRFELPSIQARPYLVVLLFASAMFGVLSQANANCAIRAGNPERTPDASFTDNGDGTVTHTTTGLVWKKCLEGRSYSSGACTGTTRTYTWPAALRRAAADTTDSSTDWRLPSRTELMSIIEPACSSPTINVTRFPNIPTSGQFWTSTHGGSSAPDSAWAVRFSNGSSVIFPKNTAAYVLLVRGGDAHESWRATVPTEPALFAFAPQTVLPGSTTESNEVTMSSLTAPRSVKIVGGEYQINAGAWTSADGTIANGNKLKVRVAAPSTVPATASTTVNVNGRTATFVVTTSSQPDSVPDSFTFTDLTGVFPSAVTASNAITVAGINQPADLSVTGGEYEINGNGIWTSAAGAVLSGSTVKVRHAASASHLATVNTVLSIGGVSDTFSTTTAARDITPNAFTFTDQTGVTLSTLVTSNAITVSGINDSVSVSITNGEYEKNNSGTWTSTAGTVINGDTVRVRRTSSSGYNTAVTTVLNIAGVTDTFSVTTLVRDVTPDAFIFTDRTGVLAGLVITSNAITVSGINDAVSISVTGGEYEVNNSGSWSSGAGSVVNGDIVRVRHTVSATIGATVNTVLTIGGVSDTFSSTSAARDITPNAFSFTDQTNVDRSTLYTSNTITVAGINDTVNVSVTGGEYEKNGSGVWTSVAGTAESGDTIRVRHTSGAGFSATVNTVLTVGTGSDTFSTTTLPIDTAPDAFGFAAVTGAATSSQQTSAEITVSGINSPATVSVSAGGSYEKNNSGSWVTTNGTVVEGDTVKVRHTASASQNTTITTTLTIGGVQGAFSSTTCGLAEWNAQTFVDSTGRWGNAYTCTRPEIVLNNICANTALTIQQSASTTSRFDFSLNGGAFQDANSTAFNTNIGPGASIVLRYHYNTSSGSTTAYTLNTTIGGQLKSWKHTPNSSGACLPQGTFNENP